MNDSAPKTQGSLHGVRILDLSRVLAGPFATRILADHGADVIKIERPGSGDDTRRFGPPFQNGESSYFLSINSGKRSLAVDLKRPEGQRLVQRLATRCDVVIENFRPGTAERLGLGAEQLRAANPRLIYCSISGFGQTGPWRNRPGYDLAVQGLSGIQSITGPADGPPTKAGTSIADLSSGLYAVQGILMALYRREQTGRGDTIDVAMLDACVSLLTYQAGGYLADGTVPRRAGNRHPSIVPYEAFAASDGWFNLAVGSEGNWAKFCAAIDRPDLQTDPRFADNPARVVNRDALAEELAAIFQTDTVANWIDRLQAGGVPAGAIHDVDQVLEHEVTKARDMVVDLDHPKAGPIKTTGVAVKHSEAPGAIRTPPPLLGQHGREILAEGADLDAAEIEHLITAGVVATPNIET